MRGGNGGTGCGEGSSCRACGQKAAGSRAVPACPSRCQWGWRCFVTQGLPAFPRLPLCTCCRLSCGGGGSPAGDMRRSSSLSRAADWSGPGLGLEPVLWPTRSVQLCPLSPPRAQLCSCIPLYPCWAPRRGRGGPLCPECLQEGSLQLSLGPPGPGLVLRPSTALPGGHFPSG